MRVDLAHFAPPRAGQKKSLTYRFGNLTDFTTRKAKSQVFFVVKSACIWALFPFREAKKGR